MVSRRVQQGDARLGTVLPQLHGGGYRVVKVSADRSRVTIALVTDGTVDPGPRFAGRPFRRREVVFHVRVISAELCSEALADLDRAREETEASAARELAGRATYAAGGVS